MSQGQRLAEVI